MATFFCFNGEEPQFFDSPNEAKQHAENSLEYERERPGDNWSPETEFICWGLVIEAIETIAQGKIVVDGETIPIEEKELVCFVPKENNLRPNENKLAISVNEVKPNQPSEIARAVHRIVRAMHDGNCPQCGHLAPAQDFFHPANYFPSYHSCPKCGFTITEMESKAALQEFQPYQTLNIAVFQEWRKSIK